MACSIAIAKSPTGIMLWLGNSREEWEGEVKANRCRSRWIKRLGGYLAAAILSKKKKKNCPTSEILNDGRLDVHRIHCACLHFHQLLCIHCGGPRAHCALSHRHHLHTGAACQALVVVDLTIRTTNLGELPAADATFANLCPHAEGVRAMASVGAEGGVDGHLGGECLEGLVPVCRAGRSDIIVDNGDIAAFGGEAGAIQRQRVVGGQ